jgi:hypothetical protein
LREQLQTEPDAATLYRLIHDWHPANTLA